MKSYIIAPILIVLGILFALGDLTDPDRVAIAMFMIFAGFILIVVRSIVGLVASINANKKAGK